MQQICFSSSSSMECDICCKDCHMKCGRISPREFRQLQEIISFNWVCPKCLLQQLPAYCPSSCDASDITNLHSSFMSNGSSISSFADLKKPDEIKYLLINARSIVNKLPDLEQLIYSEGADIIFITETWLDDRIHSSELFDSSFHVLRKDRNRNGGGILIACKKELNPLCKNTLETDIEILWLETKTKQGKILNGCIYRPPSADLHFMDKLEESLDGVLNIHSTISCSQLTRRFQPSDQAQSFINTDPVVQHY